MGEYPGVRGERWRIYRSVMVRGSKKTRVDALQPRKWGEARGWTLVMGVTKVRDPEAQRPLHLKLEGVWDDDPGRFLHR